ncbi:hypothetical protein ACFXHD_13840 [Streptomyces hydrogenans]|uniref:hypothetical protein n=1 Tax=Streptomyces hydrogenans TaxID=1873719 RepID=UPI0036C437B1
MSMSDIDWGDAPTWIAAVFAGGAAWFAGMTLRSQRRQLREQQQFIGEQSQNLRLERAALEAAAEDRRTAQARRVIMRVRNGRSTVAGDDAPEGTDYWQVDVWNATDGPLRDVSVRFGDAYIATSAVEMGSDQVPGGGRRSIPIDMVAPNREVRFESPQLSETTVHNNRPVVSFADADGHRWVLDEYGALAPEQNQASQ